MQKFYYFLKENPKYPLEIMASSKQEVISLLKDAMGDLVHDSVLRILTEEEFTGKKSVNTNQQIVNPFTDSKNEQESSSPNSQQKAENNNSDIHIFEVKGENFKLENGILYKESWINTNDDKFRIVNSSTLKPIKSEKYIIQTLSWIKQE